LGEYLATANLVVVTKVGDIPNYLIDNESAIIAEPDSVDSFAYCLSYSIDNYNKLEQVRKQGYEVCISVFNSKIQGKRIEEFFQICLSTP
jgi:glycosyltransferase involved in cell wall biosynthesis